MKNLVFPHIKSEGALGARGVLVFRPIVGRIGRAVDSLSSGCRFPLLVDVLRINDVFVNALDVARLHWHLLRFSGFPVVVRKFIFTHMIPLMALTFSIAQADEAFQVCPSHPNLSPEVSPGQYVNCQDFDLYFQMKIMGLDHDADLLTFKPRN